MINKFEIFGKSRAKFSLEKAVNSKNDGPMLKYYFLERFMSIDH
jgi:hypothetical protein